MYNKLLVRRKRKEYVNMIYEHLTCLKHHFQKYINLVSNMCASLKKKYLLSKTKGGNIRLKLIIQEKTFSALLAYEKVQKSLKDI